MSNSSPLLEISKPGDTEVKVALTLDSETKDVRVEVSVLSNAKPGHWAHTSFDADHPDLAYAVSRGAEILAAHQCETYGDKHNPPDVAKGARLALVELMAKADKANRQFAIGAMERADG